MAATYDVHTHALKRFDLASYPTQEERESSLADRRFHSIEGAMWEDSYGDQFKNRVKLEFNFCNMAMQRLLSEFRMNRITVDFLSKTGDEGDEIADLCDGLYRSDEQDGGAMGAYDTAFEEAAGGGFGAFRLVTEYEDEYDDENDHQRIRFEGIPDADQCVYFDCNAKRADKSDASYCFVLQANSREAYEDEWGDIAASFEPVVRASNFDWTTQDLVYTAEYYEVTERSVEVFTYRDLFGNDTKYDEQSFKDDDGLEKRLRETGSKKTRTKSVKRRAVHKYILSGEGILEDCGIIAGSQIPIIPVYARRSIVQGVERFYGMVRFAKDPARLFNMQTSAVANVAAQSGTSKPIFTSEQIAGHENTWRDDAVEDYAFLTVNSLIDAGGNPVLAGPVGMTQPAQVSPAAAALIQLSREGLRDILGNQEAGEQFDTELSGKAMQMVQSKLDMQSYIYMSNFADAIKRAGTVWLAIAREIYVEPGRKMKLMDEQGGMSSVTLMDRDMDGVKNDLTNAKFDVAVDVGPSSSSKRSATVNSLLNMLPGVDDPADAKVIRATIMRNMEGEGISSIREYFRKQLVALGVDEPNDEDLAEMEEASQQPQEPDAQVVYLNAAAEEKQASAALKTADTTKTLAEAEKVAAETQETVVDTQITLQQLQRPTGTPRAL
jgi:hypothetical protein